MIFAETIKYMNSIIKIAQANQGDPLRSLRMRTGDDPDRTELERDHSTRSLRAYFASLIRIASRSYR